MLYFKPREFTECGTVAQVEDFSWIATDSNCDKIDIGYYTVSIMKFKMIKAGVAWDS